MNLGVAMFRQSYHLHLATGGGGTVEAGSSNRKAVRALQQRLSHLGFALEEDGVFGSHTQDAVKAFQKKHQLEDDGKVGPKTLDMLLRAKAPKKGPSADPGIDAIEDVVAPGISQPQSGRGLGTLRAQQRGGGNRSGRGRGAGAQSEPKGPHGGSIDPTTGAEVASSKTGPIGSTEPKQPSNYTFEQAHPRGPGGMFATKSGDSGERVRADQTRLKKAGADIKTDGQFGPKTNLATRRFQRENGLTVDGVIGPVTRSALKTAGRRRA